MREFAQNGTFTTKWNSGFGVTPAGIAVDSSETLYVVRGNPAVERLSSLRDGPRQRYWFPIPPSPTFNGPTTGLAVDPATGDLYVDDGGTRIRQYANPSTCVAHGNQVPKAAYRRDLWLGQFERRCGVAVKRLHRSRLRLRPRQRQDLRPGHSPRRHNRHSYGTIGHLSGARLESSDPMVSR